MSTEYFEGSGGERRVSLLPGSDALVELVLGLVLIAVAISCMVLWPVLGIGVAFVGMFVISVRLPGSVPLIIVAGLMFQNMIIAAFSPLIETDAAFDTLRGTNFVVLMTTYAAFLLATFQPRMLSLWKLRPWLKLSLALLVVVTFYFLLGAVLGEPRDALVYFRNTITPLACFHVALVAAALYRVDVTRGLIWLGGGAVLYGYCELFFTMDFLSLFNGDQYLLRQFQTQVDTGVWERTLAETGFVVRNMKDMMTTSFFNTTLFNDFFPAVFRIAGPNFHQISFAYSLTTIATWLLFQRNWWFAIAAMPLLLVVGSKGATAMLIFAVILKLLLLVVRPRLALMLVTVTIVAFISSALLVGVASGDYHVLGFFAGLKGFLSNPLGHGLGIGGNLSTVSYNLDWNLAQATGATDTPVESALGVMLYQMGIGGALFFAFVAGVALLCGKLFIDTRDQAFAFGFVALVSLTANAVLQEEAYLSPLGLGFTLLLVGVRVGSHFRRPEQADSLGLPSITPGRGLKIFGPRRS